MSGRFFLSVVSLVTLSSVMLGQADEVLPEPPVHDPFNGKFRLPWKVLRPDEKRWSLVKNKGKLTITTQRGTIHTKVSPGMEAKNLFLISNPYGRAADFEVSVRVCDFKPTAFWQQGGLLLYDDDDNYIKFVCEATGDKTNPVHLVLIRETAGKSGILHAPAPQKAEKIWLRLTRRKNKYEYASSGDGKKWTVHGTTDWGEKGPAKVGILAKNGPKDAPEIDVCFEDFRARQLVRAKANKD